MPYPLEVPPTPGQREWFTEEVYRGLAERGLVRGKVVDARLADLLGLLAEHHTAVDVVGDIGYPVRALAAAGRGTGVLAVLAGGELWLTAIPPADLAVAVAGVLPLECPGTPGENPRIGGRFGVSAPDRRLDSPVCWLDTDEGRYLLSRNGSTLDVEPADPTSIERCLAAVLTQADLV
ncbi:ESX secretion-associated protein EspG [Amycolatopsis bartoniae]|nr:ESX secretion-associated protein EspG [Amycolatopsis bartoniae]